MHKAWSLAWVRCRLGMMLGASLVLLCVSIALFQAPIASASTSPALTLSTQSGAVGSSVTATAGGFTGEDLVQFTFDGDTVGSCTTSSTGQCAVAVQVPALPFGSYDVTANDSSDATVSATFSVIASVALSAPAGQVGSALTLTANGFDSGEMIDFSYASVPSGSCTTGANGSCSVSLNVPAGSICPYTVAAVGTTSGLTASTTFYETGPLSLIVTPSSGFAYSTFNASAQGFEPGETVAIGYPGTDERCIAGGPTGACSVSLSAPPGPTRTITVTATGLSSGFEASGQFTTLPSLGISPGQGVAGSTLGLGPEEFAASETVQFTFDGLILGSCVTDANGTCPITNVIVPSVPAGTIQIVATDQDGNVAVRIFSVEPSVTLSPTTGPEGTTENATAQGFQPGETVNVSYASSLMGSCVASSKGSCPVAFEVPAEHQGLYPVAAMGTSSGLAAQTNFDETPTFTLSPGSGAQGSSFIATVQGFAANEVVQITFDGPTATTIGSCTADTNGDCAATLVTPTVPGGHYFLSANGSSSGDWATGNFVVTPAVTASPASVSPGQPTTFTVSGFGLVETVDLSMNGSALGSCRADVNGDCTATVFLPNEPPGSSIVTATGTTTNLSATTPFTIIGPVITSVAPNEGKLTAGTAVTITGSNFTENSVVYFGSKMATSVTVENSSTISALSPAGTGTVDVTVVTPQDTSTTSPADQFTYLPVPKVSAISQAAGPTGGSTTITITGTGFANPATVAFGSVAASSVTVVNSTTITATSPPGTGTVAVRVSTIGGVSSNVTADHYTYLPPPTVTKVTPASGPLMGGTVIAITGTGFTNSSKVYFGGVPANTVTFSSATKLHATSPSGSGAVDVTVVTLGGVSTTSLADQFTYLPVPTVTAISPASGKAGTIVTVTGTGFTAPATVYFGTAKATATGVVVVNSTTMTAKAPSGSGNVDLTVTTPGGTSAVSLADRFTY